MSFGYGDLPLYRTAPESSLRGCIDFMTSRRLIVTRHVYHPLVIGTTLYMYRIRLDNSATRKNFGQHETEFFSHRRRHAKPRQQRNAYSSCRAGRTVSR